MSRQMKVSLNLLTLATDPLNAIAGDVYFNTATKNLRIHNGTQWLELTPPSTDPTPFYRHTHSFDGEVHTIDTENIIDFKSINENDGIVEVLPIINKFDGGSPGNVYFETPSFVQLTLLDDGQITGETTTDTITDGGSSVDDPNATILDGGSSHGN